MRYVSNLEKEVALQHQKVELNKQRKNEVKDNILLTQELRDLIGEIRIWKDETVTKIAKSEDLKDIPACYYPESSLCLLDNTCPVKPNTP